MSVVAEYIPENDDSYTTKCKVIESHKTLFEVNISCANQDQAKFVAENWQKNAVKLYPKFIELLTEEQTDQKLCNTTYIKITNYKIKQTIDFKITT